MSKVPIVPKLFYVRSDGGDGLEAVMTLPDGTNVIAPVDLNWMSVYGALLLDWAARRLRGARS